MKIIILLMSLLSSVAFGADASNLQKITFTQAQLNEFSTRLVDYLHNEFPDSKKIPTSSLLSGVKQQIKNAASYGLETEQQIAIYTQTAWLLGLEFDNEFPAAKSVLNSAKYSATEKVQFLEKWTVKMFETLEGK
jgi:hypothetical protein